MEKIKGYHIGLTGTSEEIGRKQAEYFKRNPEMLKYMLGDCETASDKEFRERRSMLDEFCPGINEEIEGFCDELKISPHRIGYYFETWLKPGCSHGALLAPKTDDGHIYVFRNYDFSEKVDDMRLCSTHVKGKYAHTGFSISFFGRSEGMNEHGLCISNSSCGMPVGLIPGLRQPSLQGLQFWAVTRVLLENCRNVTEALQLIRDLPVTYNLNMILTDASGRATGVERLEEAFAVRECNPDQSFLVAVNHGVTPEINAIEPFKFKNSRERYARMQEYFGQKRTVSQEDIKYLLENEYPQGVTAKEYDNFFGTIRSMIFDVTDKTVEFCYGSPVHNPWMKLRVGEILPFEEMEAYIEKGSHGSDFFDIVE